FQSEAIINRCSLSSNLNELTQPLDVMIDSGQLKQVFLNLIKNSMEAIRHAEREKGSICLSVYKRLQTVDIHIQDNGIGMDTMTLSKLFQPFFTTKKKGTGLGLFLCKQIIQNHRGTIQVSSAPSIGTTFIVQLPIVSVN
ncbi:MAG: ATP-binding protein, partial [Anaerobacillus sp.]